MADHCNASARCLPCSVCGSPQTRPFLEIDAQRYVRCDLCAATLLHPDCFLSASDERAHYDTHENDPTDSRYRTFLSRLADPLLARLPSAQNGLDYGCGPGPALAQMLREAGHTMATYDPFYDRNAHALSTTYDFITCTETVEHFHRPNQEFRRFDGLLRPGGVVAIMTMFQTDDDRFAAWYYRKDPTHVVFYRTQTMQVIAREFGWSCEFPAPNVTFFVKST